MTYLFWEDYSIENYHFVVVCEWDDYEDFLTYCKRVMFPIFDRKGYLIESYDFKKQTVFVLDISEWALDIEMFLRGKYSKMSQEAKSKITEFHTFYHKGPKIMIKILAVLEPMDTYPLLNNATAIEYVAENYELSLKDLKQMGELGSIYDKEKETLIIC